MSRKLHKKFDSLNTININIFKINQYIDNILILEKKIFNELL